VLHLRSFESFITSQLDFVVYICDLCVIRYKVEVSGKSLPVLTNLDKGKYGVIVFENLNKYLQMDKWNRELLDKYCREYSVGIVGFNPPSEETLVGAQLRGFPLFIHTNLKLKVSSLCLHNMFVVSCYCLLFQLHHARMDSLYIFFLFSSAAKMIVQCHFFFSKLKHQFCINRKLT